MASNKTATVVLFDVGASVSQVLDDSETFFKKSQWCFLRIIQRLIFSEENDEIGAVLFGCKETDNNLANNVDKGMYTNIVEFSYLHKADWDLYEKVQKLSPTDVIDSNWLDGLIVALDYLRNQCKGKRFKDKQVIILSNFAMELQCKEGKLNTIAEVINVDNVKLVTIGVDLESEEICSNGSIDILLTLIDKVNNGIGLSFTEAEEDLKYYKKKRKAGRFTKVNLTIGSKIDIPIRWIKLNLEPTRIKWAKKPSSRQFEPTPTVYSESQEVESEIKLITEDVKTTRFGNSEVILDYADIEAMKRKTGAASCVLIGCVKSSRIRREMFIGQDLYLVVPEKIPRAQAMLSAFVDALIANDKYALVKRIATYNGKIKIGVLIPVSHETDDGICKELYFLQLPFAEYQQFVPDVRITEPNDPEILEAFDNLIDAMMIPDKPKDLPMKDPIFQYRCHILQLYQTGELDRNSPNPPVPDFIQKLFDPYPELKENGRPFIEKLRQLLPIHIEEKYLDTEEIKEWRVPTSPDKNQPNSAEVESWVNAETEEWPGELPETSKAASSSARNQSDIEKESDWKMANTEEWPTELPESSKAHSSNNCDITLPAINLNENALAKNKYNTNYVSEKLWKDHGVKRQLEISADVQEMLDQRQQTKDYDTEEMLLRLKNK